MRVDILMGHSGRRFIEKHHLRIERERRGDLERPLAAIWQFHGNGIGVFRKADLAQQRLRAIVESTQYVLRPPEVETAASRALQRQPDIVKRGEMGKHGGDLEASYDSKTSNVGRAQMRDVPAFKTNGAAGRRQELAHHVEASGLTCAVRTDQRMDRSVLHPQVNIVDCNEPVKLLMQADRLENDVAAHRS